MNKPKARTVLDASIMDRGINIFESRPVKGGMLETAILKQSDYLYRYEVNGS